MIIPKVSICIPVYNGEKYILESINSVFNQTFQDYEIVVSDDGSSDHSLEIVKQIFKKEKFNNFLIIHNPNPGIGNNWNHCIKYSKGEYIKFLFQDDVLFPDCLKEMVDFLDNNNLVGAVACQREIIMDEDLNLYGENWLKNYEFLQKNLNDDICRGNYYWFDKKFLKSDLFLKISPLNKIGEPTAVMFRRSLINNIGLFRDDLNQLLDVEFWIRILKVSPIVVLKIKLVSFRLHSGQASHLNSFSNFSEWHHFNKILFDDYLFFLSFKESWSLSKKYSLFIRRVFKVKRLIFNFFVKV